MNYVYNMLLKSMNEIYNMIWNDSLWTSEADQIIKLISGPCLKSFQHDWGT